MERVRWLERNILVAASRVLKHMLAERERVRAECMLEVCGALIDLDTSILSLKIVKHVSNFNIKLKSKISARISTCRFKLTTIFWVHICHVMWLCSAWEPILFPVKCSILDIYICKCIDVPYIYVCSCVYTVKTDVAVGTVPSVTVRWRNPRARLSGELDRS